MMKSSVLLLTLGVTSIHALAIPYTYHTNASISLDGRADLGKPGYEGDHIWWYSDDDVTKCGRDDSVNGKILSGSLKDHHFTGRIFNRDNQLRSWPAKPDGVCFNLDKYVLNPTNKNDKKLLSQSTAKKFAIWSNRQDYQTIIFFPRANCDLAASDTASYAYLNKKSNGGSNCYLIRSEDHSLAVKNEGPPDIVSFYIYQRVGLNSAENDPLTCKDGQKWGDRGCVLMPLLTKDPAKEAEEKAKDDAKKAKEKADKEAKEKADKKAKEEAKEKADKKAEAEAKEKADKKAEEKAKEEADQKAKEKAKEKADQKSKEEAKEKTEEKAEKDTKMAEKGTETESSSLSSTPTETDDVEDEDMPTQLEDDNPGPSTVIVTVTEDSQVDNLPTVTVDVTPTDEPTESEDEPLPASTVWVDPY